MLDYIHKISEIIAAFAIVGSLIFVGVQVNQNTSALRNSAAQANSDSWQQNTLAIATNPTLARMWVEHLDFPEDVPMQPTPELLMIASYIGANLKSMESNYHQWMNGNLSDELFEGARTGLVFQLEVQPLMAQFLQGPGMAAYTESFVAFAHEALAEAQANKARRQAAAGNQSTSEP